MAGCRRASCRPSRRQTILRPNGCINGRTSVYVGASGCPRKCTSIDARFDGNANWPLPHAVQSSTQGSVSIVSLVQGSTTIGGQDGRISIHVGHWHACTLTIIEVLDDSLLDLFGCLVLYRMRLIVRGRSLLRGSDSTYVGRGHSPDTAESSAHHDPPEVIGTSLE